MHWTPFAVVALLGSASAHSHADAHQHLHRKRETRRERRAVEAYGGGGYPVHSATSASTAVATPTPLTYGGNSNAGNSSSSEKILDGCSIDTQPSYCLASPKVMQPGSYDKDTLGFMIHNNDTQDRTYFLSVNGCDGRPDWKATVEAGQEAFFPIKDLPLMNLGRTSAEWAGRIVSTLVGDANEKYATGGSCTRGMTLFEFSNTEMGLFVDVSAIQGLREPIEFWGARLTQPKWGFGDSSVVCSATKSNPALTFTRPDGLLAVRPTEENVRQPGESAKADDQETADFLNSKLNNKYIYVNDEVNACTVFPGAVHVTWGSVDSSC